QNWILTRLKVRSTGRSMIPPPARGTVDSLLSRAASSPPADSSPHSLPAAIWPIVFESSPTFIPVLLAGQPPCSVSSLISSLAKPSLPLSKITPPYGNNPGQCFLYKAGRKTLLSTSERTRLGE